MNDEFQIILEALLDQTSLSKIEKDLAKKKISLGIDLEFAKSIKDAEKQIDNMSARFKTLFNLSDKDAMSFTKKYLSEANKLIVQNEKAVQQAEDKKQKKIEQTITAYNKQQQAKEKAESQNTKNRTSNINSILAEEIQSLNKIAELRAKIVTQESGGNTSQASVLREQLKIEQEHYSTLRQEASGYTDIISHERQRKVLKEEAYEAELKVKQAQAKVEDKTNLQVEKAKNAELQKQVANVSELSRLSKANTLQSWADNNSKAMKKWGTEINEIIAKYKNLEKAMTPVEFQELETKSKSFQLAARQAGDLGATAGEKLYKAWNKFGGWSIATTSLMSFLHSIKNGVNLIFEFDDAMTDVEYTSDITARGLEKVANKSMQMSKDMSTSAKNVLEAVKIYSTANSTADDILRKTQPAIMLSNISGMSGSESSKSINTALNQFELEDTEEGLLDIVDTLQYISSQLNYDFTAGIKEINEGIEASGNVAYNAGLSMQEYAAKVGLAVEKTGQSGSTIGNAYKTIFSRITKASKIEGTLDEDISKAEESLKSIGVKVRDSENEFRDLTDIMHDLGDVWDSLSSVEKSNIGFNVAGTRQLNILNSLLGSWNEYESIMSNIDDRTGMTMENQEIYAESLKGKLGELTATGESIWTNLLNSDGLKSGVDTLAGLLTIVEKLTDSLGLLGTVGVLGSGILGAKNVGGAIINNYSGSQYENMYHPYKYGNVEQGLMTEVYGSNDLYSYEVCVA